MSLLAKPFNCGLHVHLVIFETQTILRKLLNIDYVINLYSGVKAWKRNR